MLVLMQSVAAALPGPALQDPLAALADSGQDAIPCDHMQMADDQPMPCCDESPLPPEKNCGNGDCRCADALLTAASVLLPPTAPTIALLPVTGIAANADAWPTTRHDAPPLRPPISA